MTHDYSQLFALFRKGMIKINQTNQINLIIFHLFVISGIIKLTGNNDTWLFSIILIIPKWNN